MWLLRNIRLFKNWPSLYFGGLIAKTRSGLELRMHTRHDIPILWEVLGEDCYNVKAGPLGKTIVDIGGNIGSFSLFAAHMNPTANVFAFEPSPTNVTLLRENIRRNSMINRVSAFEKAVAGDEESRLLHIAKHGDSGHNSFYDIGGDDDLVEVECTTLDRIIENVGEIDFLKIDVEGAEREILEASQLVGTHVKKIVIEGDESIADVLRGKGFNVEIPSRLFIVATKFGS